MFDVDVQNYERGVFAVEPWWVGKKGYEKYSAFHPNEFGDKVVGLEIDTSVKTYKQGEQIDALEDLFPDSPNRQKIIDKYEKGEFLQPEWQKLDGLIGKRLRKQGYKLIRYTADQMYGEVWVIIHRSVIKSIRHN
jgi:hypothetical protein